MHCQKIIEGLSEIKSEGCLVIVEGKKDRKSLEKFGIKNIIDLKNRPLFEIAENINEKEVVILTDLDYEGRKLFSRLRHDLQRKGIRINNKIRNELFRTRLRNLEGLDSYLKLYEF